LLRLIHDVGRVDAVVGEIVIVAAASRKSNRPLVAATGIYSTRHQPRQRCPVASVDRQLIRLHLLNTSAQRVGATVHLLRTGRDLHVLLASCYL